MTIPARRKPPVHYATARRGCGPLATDYSPVDSVCTLKVDLGCVTYWNPKEELGTPRNLRKRAHKEEFQPPKLTAHLSNAKEWHRGILRPLAYGQRIRQCQRVVEEDLEASEFVDDNNYSTGEVIGSFWAPVTGGAAIGHRPHNQDLGIPATISANSGCGYGLIVGTRGRSRGV